MSLKIGDKIPSFTLKDQDGKDFNIDELVGKKAIVIFFYPKDFTPGCIKEVCSFRDQYEDFTDLGAEVIGISGDSENSHDQFAKKYKLPFTLLSDKNKKVRNSFGVKSSLLGLLPGRVTFVIDKKGIVQLIFENQFGAEEHIAESLNILKNSLK
jgi:peroxiredoxin Q/BCP